MYLQSHSEHLPVLAMEYKMKNLNSIRMNSHESRIFSLKTNECPQCEFGSSCVICGTNPNPQFQEDIFVGIDDLLNIPMQDIFNPKESEPESKQEPETEAMGDLEIVYQKLNSCHDNSPFATQLANNYQQINSFNQHNINSKLQQSNTISTFNAIDSRIKYEIPASFGVPKSLEFSESDWNTTFENPIEFEGIGIQRTYEGNLDNSCQNRSEKPNVKIEVENHSISNPLGDPERKLQAIGNIKEVLKRVLHLGILYHPEVGCDWSQFRRHRIGLALANSGRVCPLCSFGFDLADVHGRVVQLDCRHILHEVCFLHWVKVNRCCPKCYKEIVRRDLRGRECQTSNGSIGR